MKWKISNSIRNKIFVYMFVFAILIILIIGLGTRFILPAYFYNKQMTTLDETTDLVEKSYLEDRIDEAIVQMEIMEHDLGGELYYYDENTGSEGYENEKGNNRVTNANSDKFISTGDISTYIYINKIGLEIYVIGIRIDDNFLVYEVEIQSLTRATETMMDFLVILLGIVLLLGLGISFIMAKNISKPIKDLNHLAESMKSKNVNPKMVTKGDDEIARLNVTLNSLYEELQGNIYKLNAELNKERNAEKLKKRFLAQATHELKTPIAVIRGYAEILYDGMYKDENERYRFLKNIYDESESVSRLILDVLDYTKMETGNYKLRKDKIEINKYVEDLFLRYGEYIKSLDLISQVEVDIPGIFFKEMDKERIDQVYKNLISNAVEHSKSIIISRATVVGTKIKLSVYNDGKPISEEDLPNVFESFYKSKGKRNGTGMGLAIVKEIVTLHNGEYRVVNHEDGVEFIVII